jgi:putative holliday junction resolvase
MRYLGIDYGSKRVGLALSDESGTMAFPHKVLPNSPTLGKEIEMIITKNKVDEIVIGHSLDKQSKPNKIQAAIEELMMDLTLATGLPIHLQPEQFSTQAALQIQGRNDMTDAAAAALILDSFITKKK